MKLNYKLSLTIIASLAIILPMAAVAQDQRPDEKKQDSKKSGGQRRGAEVAPQGATHVSPSATGKSRGENVRNNGRAKAVPQSNVAPVAPQHAQPTKRVERSQRDQIPTNVAPMTSQRMQPRNRLEGSHRNQTHGITDQKAYNKGNNYGGLWSAENTHSDWKRNGNYYWNHHNYRWYEGGWLIIDGGYSPYGLSAGSTASNVQMRLANQGYYSGPIDGDIGPMSRNAIADYQSDHDLRVTGHINDSLLQSLQIE